MEGLARIPVRVELASEFRYRNPILDPNGLVIIISQSGETADSLAALREAKARGIRTLGIVNVVGSSIAREADNVFYTLAVSLAGMSVLAMLVSRPANFGQALACLAAFVICAICILPNSDYGWYGFALMMFLWFSRRSKPLQAVVLLLWCYAEYVVYIHNWAYFAAAALAVIPVLLYNGRRGRPVKLFFYMIYPLHLAVFGMLVLVSAAL